MVRIGGLVCLSWLLSACAAVGYFPTNDPLEKTRDAHSLIVEGRAQMAEIFLKEAVVMLEKEPNKTTEAEVNFAFGELYASEAYHAQRSIFEENGTYDGTYNRSIAYYKKAIDLFDQQGEDVGVVKSLYGLGQAQMLKGENQASCGTYYSALNVYDTGKLAGRITQEPEIYGGIYKSSREFVMAAICSNCMGLARVPLEECFSKFN